MFLKFLELDKDLYALNVSHLLKKHTKVYKINWNCLDDFLSVTSSSPPSNVVIIIPTY